MGQLTVKGIEPRLWLLSQSGVWGGISPMRWNDMKHKKQKLPKCPRCLDKGWGSVLERKVWSVDFPGDKPGEETRIGRVFCPHCRAGKRMAYAAESFGWFPWAPSEFGWVYLKKE